MAKKTKWQKNPRHVQQIDFEAEVKIETALALLLFTGRRSVWVPKSKVRDNNDGTFTMAKWRSVVLRLF
jgi:hypothetical protein